MEPIAKPPHDAGADPPPTAEPPPGARRRPLAGGLGDMIGGALVGFDYQVFRATKPPAILVEAAKPVRGLSGEDGSMLSLGFPLDEPVSDAETQPDAGTGDVAGRDRLE